MSDSSISDLINQQNELKVKLARFQQPIFNELIDVLQEDNFTNSLDQLQKISAKFAGSSVIESHMNNIRDFFAMVAQTIAREMTSNRALIDSVDNPTPVFDPATLNQPDPKQEA